MKPTRFTPELVDKLLDKLGSDDEFRKKFRHDAKAAMIELGAPPHFNCGVCLEPRELASKEDIRHTRAVIRDKLLGDGSHDVQCLESR